MKAVAIIPARGGSKELPRKNVLPLCGKPLIAWTIEAARKAKTVERVVVSTDDAQIADISLRCGAEVVWRPLESAADDASSEAALLHVLQHLGLRGGVLVFLQCTAPLTLPEDIDGTVRLLERADSAFTATPWHGFLWADGPDGAVPIGHDKAHRPRRQDRRGEYLEVGAVYATKIEAFLAAPHRFHGSTAIYPLPPERSIDIDDETDFLLAAALMRQRLHRQKSARLPANITAVVMDFDGVLTDNRVTVAESGRESVVCSRADGWAIGKLRARGIRLLVLTQETNPAVRQRCRKLGVECIVARGDKLGALTRWLKRYALQPEAAVYVGNDEPDVGCMMHVGCGVAPADADLSAKQAAQIVLDTRGGQGCIRELYRLITSDRGEVS